MEEIEVWKPIPEFEGIYEASSLGRIKRIKSGAGARAGRILKPKIDKDGYLHVSPFKDGKAHCRTVHKLIASAFLGPRPEGKQINHIDTNKVNNRPNNLEYLTRLEHEQHAIKMGQKPTGDNHWTRMFPERVPKGDDAPSRKYKDRMPRGEINNKCKYSDAQIQKVLIMIEDGKSLTEIARYFDISVAHVYRLKNGQARAYLKEVTV